MEGAELAGHYFALVGLTKPEWFLLKVQTKKNSKKRVEGH